MLSTSQAGFKFLVTTLHGHDCFKQEIEIDEYQCEFCSSVFEYEEDLDEHVLSHFHNFGDGETLPEKQTCRYCQKEYYALKYHIETNHPDKLSSKKSKKKDKKKDKRDKKGRKTLTCPVCNNEFKGIYFSLVQVTHPDSYLSKLTYQL